MHTCVLHARCPHASVSASVSHVSQILKLVENLFSRYIHVVYTQEGDEICGWDGPMAQLELQSEDVYEDAEEEGEDEEASSALNEPSGPL